MECIYLPEIHSSTSKIVICDDEFKHLKALHIRAGEEIYASNGKGIIAKLIVSEIDKKNAIAQIINMDDRTDEVIIKKGLALGVLDNKDRFEFALEKAVELGITDFYPLLTDFSQRKNVVIDRLISKSIAAMKQSKRHYLTTIHTALTIDKFIKQTDANILFADMHTDKQMGIANSDSIILVGPEGGFSERENELLKSCKNCMGFTLGHYRLRAETAAIASLSIYNFLLNK